MPRDNTASNNQNLSQIFGGAACPAHRDFSFLTMHWKNAQTAQLPGHDSFETLYVYNPATQSFVPKDQVSFAALAVDGKDQFEINEMDLLLIDKNHDEVLKRANEALEENPDDISALNYKAIALYHKGDFEGSLALNQQIIALDPDNSSAHHNMALDLIDLGRDEEALASLEKSINLDPDYMPGHTHKAEVLRKLGRHEEAFKVFEHALKNPSQTLYLTDTALYTAHRMGFETTEQALDFIESRKNAPFLQNFPRPADPGLN